MYVCNTVYGTCSTVHHIHVLHVMYVVYIYVCEASCMYVKLRVCHVYMNVSYV